MDTKTVAITLIISLSAQACLGLVIAVYRRDKAITTWAAGFVVSALGFGLLLAQGAVPPLFSVVLANLLLISFNVALVVGARYFLDLRPAWPWRYFLYFGIWLVLESTLTFWSPNYPLRAALTSAATVLMILELAVTLRQGRQKIVPIVRTLFWTLIGTVLAFHTGRALLVLSSSAGSMWTDQLITVTTLVFSLISSFIWSGALLLWDASRLSAEVVAHSAELRRLNDLKDRVMALTGHDLRGPMGNLQLLWSELGSRLRQKDYSAVDDEVLGMVDRSLAGTQSLLDNLFSFAESQQTDTTEQRPADLTLALLQVKAQWEAPAQTKHVAVEMTVSRSWLVRAGAHALEAVFRNLVGNAVKFTPSGGRVIVRAAPLSEQMLEVTVEDTGVGMAQDWLEKVFMLDSKVSRPGTDGERGSGFGLTLVRELIRGWKGTLNVTSVVGSGTVVRVTIPLSPTSS